MESEGDFSAGEEEFSSVGEGEFSPGEGDFSGPGTPSIILGIDGESDEECRGSYHEGESCSQNNPE